MKMVRSNVCLDRSEDHSTEIDDIEAQNDRRCLIV